jgi:adenine deaminase
MEIVSPGAPGVVEQQLPRRLDIAVDQQAASEPGVHVLPGRFRLENPEAQVRNRVRIALAGEALRAAGVRGQGRSGVTEPLGKLADFQIEGEHLTCRRLLFQVRKNDAVEGEGVGEPAPLLERPRFLLHREQIHGTPRQTQRLPGNVPRPACSGKRARRLAVGRVRRHHTPVMRDDPLFGLLAAARGDVPADLVLRRARVVDIFSAAVIEADVALSGEAIVGLGDGFRARETVDLAGRFVLPGLIDAHVHVESSMVPPREFARAVVPRGVTTVVTDPHEIANVHGLDGIRFMLEDARNVPLAMLVNASSCVPATTMGTAGATLSAEDLAPLLDEPAVLGLAEVMNFPGTVMGDEDVLAKLRAFAGRPIDGHAPGLSGRQLGAYVAAGIWSDHECTTVDEAREKIRLGMTVFLREATNAKNLRTLLPLVTAETERRFCLCTDDRQPPDLLAEGSIDHLIRLAVGEGVPPVRAIRMATLNTAEHFRLRDRGAIAPGRRADLVVVDDLATMQAEAVYVAGRLVAREGELLGDSGQTDCAALGDSIHIDWSRVDLQVPARGTRVRVIGAVPDQLVTRHEIVEATIEAGCAVADPARDLLKMAVIERHGRDGGVGVGFVTGIGLERGAIASTVAHDHHNLVVIGADDRSMLTAARAAGDAGGGQVAAIGDRVLAVLSLPIAGLMSDRPIGEVRSAMEGLIAAARELRSRLHDPFMAMSFLALEVIPSLKLTDKGLVDVDQFGLVPLFAD